MTFSRLIFFVFILLGLNACKKEDPPIKTDNNNPPGTDQEMIKLTATPWMAYRADFNGINVWDFLVDACQKDDSYKFNRDSTVVQYENANVCSGNPDSTTNNWNFYSGNKKLIGTFFGITDTATIVTLIDKEMKLDIDYDGTPVTLYFKRN